ncbi:MAG: hypothetical protein J5802_00120 [Butyrivibrio sp.]|nr:hypothetical protein [Butyrivibrio sp.]
MKKRTTTAILLATTMMFALMGCGAASTDTDSSSDAASVAEVDTDTESNTSEETADTGSDSASADSSDAADTATASADDSFTYKGETFSVLDDFQTTLDKINAVGTPAPKTPVEYDDGSKLYDYDVTEDSCNFYMETAINNGTETVGHIGIMDPDSKTAKGISVGSTVEELTSAYGEPTEKKGNGSIYAYKFDKSSIYFVTDNGKVIGIDYFTSDFVNARS